MLQKISQSHSCQYDVIENGERIICFKSPTSEDYKLFVYDLKHEVWGYDESQDANPYGLRFDGGNWE